MSRTGETDAREGDGTYVPNHDKRCGLTPPERAFVHIYRSLGLTNQQVAQQLDLAPETVGGVLQDTRERVEDGEDPMDVFADTVGYLLTVEPAGGDGVDDGDAEERDAA